MTIALSVQRSPDAARKRRFAWLASGMRFLPILPTLLFLLVFFIFPVGEILQGGLFNADGVCCYGTNTHVEEMRAARLSGDGEVRFAIESLDLVEGTYKLDVAVHKKDGFPYDYHRLLYTFRVKSRTGDVGIYRPRHQWTFSPGIQFKSDQP